MRRSAVVLMLAVFLAACGQKGPLYLPSAPPSPPPAPSADKDDEKKEDGTAASPAAQP